MAGDHQIWRLDLSARTLGPFAGSGREGIADGSLTRATFSQPSGLALKGGKLYVADAEASAIREIDLTEGRVRTLVGKGLFDFGDRDGSLARAELQHAQGLGVLDDGRLLVADTYNHKLKLLDPQRGEIRTLVGKGKPGAGANPAPSRLNEPAGLAVISDQVLIADTNNGRILAYDLDRKSTTDWKPAR